MNFRPSPTQIVQLTFCGKIAMSRDDAARLVTGFSWAGLDQFAQTLAGAAWEQGHVECRRRMHELLAEGAAGGSVVAATRLLKLASKVETDKPEPVPAYAGPIEAINWSAIGDSVGTAIAKQRALLASGPVVPSDDDE
jgi:hypothetical protein